MTKKQCKGWKVISREDRMSCTKFQRIFPVQYLKNRITRRLECEGPLAVFETRKAAREFISSGSFVEWHKQHWRIVKCIFTRSKDCVLWEGYIKGCEGNPKGSKWSRSIVPPRTAFADSVICLA